MDRLKTEAFGKGQDKVDILEVVLSLTLCISMDSNGDTENLGINKYEKYRERC
jgi:hypothetical protein